MDSGKFKTRFREGVHGGSSLTQALKNYFEGLEKVTDRSMRKIAKGILAESKELVPLDSGELQKSGKVVKDRRFKGKIKYRIEYSAKNKKNGYNYAFIQHEKTSYNHSGGRTCWYLKIPFENAYQDFLANLANDVRKGGK